MSAFIPGIELSRRFYLESVRPLLDARFPGLPHAAARIGSGSEVLGFDTEMSTDHEWGPAVQLFLPEAQIGLAHSIREVMRHELPREFYGYPTHFGDSPDEPGTQVMQSGSDGPINHHVTVSTVREFAQQHLAYDPALSLEAADWLTISSQKLREVTAGEVFFDEAGELTALRERLAYYPHDVWLYMLAAQWQRIGQEEHLMPRAGYAGDELGSSIIGSRLVRDIMGLCFLMERQYAPYPKWYGTAFKQLVAAERLLPVLAQVQAAETWQERNKAIAEACRCVERMHNALDITESMPEEPTHFFGRPFLVIWGSKFAGALLERIADPEVLQIASGRLIGSIDQFSDSTDLRSDVSRRHALKALYLPGGR
jgi:hypothetical protein